MYMNAHYGGTAWRVLKWTSCEDECRDVRRNNVNRVDVGDKREEKWTGKESKRPEGEGFGLI